jgi:oxygen-dependent protoporphyrinogen oxidase
MKIAIVGGGISGLSAAWQANQDGSQFTLFEAGPKLGGILQTEYLSDGVVLEAGAESCLRSKPELLDLCQELGLEDEVVATLPHNAGAYVLRGGELHSIPQGVRLMAPSSWWPFLRSDLISWTGKFRAALDLVLPVRERTPEISEESLAQFVSRRLGVEVYHYLAQPLVAGIYGADPQKLSLEATMPLFQRLEQEHGSVIKGLRALGTEQEAHGARYNLFFSLKRGFGSVVEALESKLPKGSLRTGAVVDSISPVEGENGWDVTVRGESTERFDGLVLALPAPRTADLVASFLPETARSLRGITYRGAVTVNLAFDRETYLDFVPQAYGFVVPSQEKRPILACTFSSRKWPERGSEKYGVLRTYFGGPDMEWAVNATDEDLVDISLNELGDILGIDEEPLQSSVHRWPLGLPEYGLGHRQRVQEIRGALQTFPTLSMAGNFLDGVGLPDCVRLGRKAASQVAIP